VHTSANYSYCPQYKIILIFDGIRISSRAIVQVVARLGEQLFDVFILDLFTYVRARIVFLFGK